MRSVAGTIAESRREHERPAATLAASPEKTRHTAIAAEGRTVPFDRDGVGRRRPEVMRRRALSPRAAARA